LSVTEAGLPTLLSEREAIFRMAVSDDVWSRLSSLRQPRVTAMAATSRVWPAANVLMPR
jgi:hypothetical protein